MKEHNSQIILKPLVNEKSTVLAQLGKYTFEVKKDASKPQIALAIKELISVLYPKNKCEVLDVNTLPIRGRIRRSKRHGRAPRDSKKAIVTISGDALDIFSA